MHYVQCERPGESELQDMCVKSCIAPCKFRSLSCFCRDLSPRLLRNSRGVLQKAFSVAHWAFGKVMVTLSNPCLSTLKLPNKLLSLGIAEFEEPITERLHRQKAIRIEKKQSLFIRAREIASEDKAFVKTLLATKFHEELDKEETMTIEQRKSD